jgi:hypothetical protein
MSTRENLMLRFGTPNLIRNTPAAQALERKLVTLTDLVRLKVIARLHARGLPPDTDWNAQANPSGLGPRRLEDTTAMKSTQPFEDFERLLAALERELLDATDAEILAGAAELGINPAMKGSAALFGVTVLLRPHSRPESGDPNDVSATRRRPKGDTPPS